MAFVGMFDVNSMGNILQSEKIKWSVFYLDSNSSNINIKTFFCTKF